MHSSIYEGKEMPDEKIARICWNSNYWVFPSGRLGKSGEKKSFEYINGFGHEEWNFDTDKIVDDYVYGFLQQFNNKTSIHKGNIYNISFYSIERINSYKNNKWWFGKINSVEVISDEESERVYSIYEKNGWLSEMEGDLRKLNLETKAFQETGSYDFFNIRFKIYDMNLLDAPIKIKKSDQAIPSFYYNLLNKTQDPHPPKTVSLKFNFKSGHNPGKNKTVTSSKGGKNYKSLFHNEIQTNIFNILEKKHKKRNVGTENVLGYQTKVDIVVKTKNGFIFYEIKTYPTAKAAIREAIGQIIEYAYWPDQKKAEKLVIVAPTSATDETKIYITRLRKDFNLPIFYQEYDVKLNVLKSEI
jgi:hypothetical protein